MSKSIILILVSVSAFLFILILSIFSSRENIPDFSISTFEECVAAGNPVQESYPRGCNANGRHFTEDIGNVNEKYDLITIESPRPNEEITSPLEIRGAARGNWFFEASFPIYLYDENGNEIAHTIATAQGEWMTEDFVNYTATMMFEEGYEGMGRLVLRKDNPSGLPEQDDELSIPVKFR